MQAGKLRHRVIVQQPTISRNSLGEEIPSWGTFATVWASIEPLSGREYTTLRAELAQVTTRIRMRYLAGLTSKMRILHGTTVYEIVPQQDMEMRHRELEILATSNPL